MNNWNEEQLGALCDIGSSKRIYQKEYVEDGIPFYRSKEIIQQYKNEPITEPLYISNDKFVELKQKFGVPQEGDILLTSVGTLGIPYQVQAYDEFYFKDGNLTWFKEFSPKVDCTFIFYWLQSPLGKKEIDAITIGSTQKALTIEALKKMKICIPSINTQRTICSILKGLDDKIKLNYEISKTLKQIERTIYKHWFVDFEICQEGKFEESELGLIPKGWKVCSLDTVAEINSRTIKKECSFNTIRYVDISSVGEGVLNQITDYNLEDAPSRAKRLVKTGDIIWSTVRPNRKSYLYIHDPEENLVVSTGFAVITPKSLPASYLYSYLTTATFVEYLVSKAEGSAYPAVNAQTFKSSKVLIPEKNILNKYDEIIKNYRIMIAKLQKQNQDLVKIKDYLLPRLFSNEIGITEATRMVKEVLTNG
ncbi:restriction endonuclease subunit S [Bacillus mycoides]|uniref:restriction endonuclease subunit S n=1 Tax=Bacillus mycoides TaxID=1405 RepID=UPI0011A0927D|nr:restriction endonuclease subunit S [Bacillus mycoides]